MSAEKARQLDGVESRANDPPTEAPDLEKGLQHSEPDYETGRPGLSHVQSHISHHELHAAMSHGQSEPDTSQYDQYTSHRKILITFVVSVCSFLAPISSTTILAAIPEVAATYHSTGTIINLSNALYMLFMGLSPCLWGPLSQVYGRRLISLICGMLFFAFSIGTALAPNLASYFIFRMLTAYQGTAFLVVGTAVLGDIWAPTERATAMGWFFSGTLIGPAFGPFIGGIIVTFRSWRDIFWLQTALGGLGLILVFIFLPETIPSMKKDDLIGLSGWQKVRRIYTLTNPFRIFILLFDYPNLVTVALASSSLVWNMYSLLTPIRYVLNPRFHLTSPIQSGLFYIAPGCGYLIGTFFGGRWADRTVKKWIERKGRRVPEDRLRSCVPFIGLIIPGCMLVYGWTVEKAVGGIPVPVLAMVVQGIAQLFCFPSLNTYCLDVMQAKGRSAEVVASNYMIRYLFGAGGSAVVLPAVQSIGVGWFSTISALFMFVCSILLILTTRYGEEWRDKVDARKRARKMGPQKERSKDDSVPGGPVQKRPVQIVDESSIQQEKEKE